MRFLIVLMFAFLGITSAGNASPDNEVNNAVDVNIAAYNNGDFWNRYLLAIRYAELANLLANYNKYNNYYGYNQVPVQTTQAVKPFVKEDCKKVGEPCVYHEDCCSFACLTYLARCVSR
ncbi:uncharacterized protein LOC143918958 [Arctopsyche grandis]|uniref:uncharacterized protein LOC143918958 n=1 Tax=Arctopsyche grandis TaxID=121162 RepID=UPI00406D9B37